MKRKILFLCTGNSARSQMAEAIVNARMNHEWEAVSAGTIPAGYVHPNAIRALAEIGIAHHGRSKSAKEFREVPFDLVVTCATPPPKIVPCGWGKASACILTFPTPPRRRERKNK
jgi:arsenate reductase (thioredoxin)